MLKEKFEKLFKKLIIGLMAFVVFITCLPTSVNATDTVGSVSVNGGSSKSFTSLTDLYQYVLEKSVELIYASGDKNIIINMDRDWNLYEELDNTSIIVPNPMTYTINMNGHVINRGYMNSEYGLSDNNEGYDDGQVFYVQRYSTLIINGGDSTTSHKGYLNKTRNGGNTPVFTFNSTAGGNPIQLMVL